MNKKLRYAALAAVTFLLIFVLSAAALLYPNAKIVFSGITIEQSSDGGTQGFVDINLENLDAMFVSFCLQYDKDVLEPSNVSTNEVLHNKSGGMFDTSGAFFDQDEDNFPKGSFQNIPLPLTNIITVGMPVIGTVDSDKELLFMNFKPDDPGDPSDPNNTYHCDYIDMVKGVRKEVPEIMANTSNGVHVGRISFRIKDAAKFAKMSEADLRKAIKIVPFSKMITDMALLTPESLGHNTGLEVAFINEYKLEDWLSDTSMHVKYDYSVKSVLNSVEPQKKEITVSAYDVYTQSSAFVTPSDNKEKGTKADIIDYLNQNASMVTLKFTDKSEYPDVFKWTDDAILTKKDGSELKTWNPKGDTEGYTISQDYNEKFKVSIDVNVTPVTLTDYIVDNEELTYIRPTKTPEVQPTGGPEGASPQPTQSAGPDLPVVPTGTPLPPPVTETTPTPVPEITIQPVVTEEPEQTTPEPENIDTGSEDDSVIESMAQSSEIDTSSIRSKYPETLDDLELPRIAIPVLTQYIPNGGIKSVTIDHFNRDDNNSAILSLPAEFTNFSLSLPIRIGMTGVFSQSVNLGTTYPWLTVDSQAKPKAVRNIVESASDLPKQITAFAVTDDGGNLTITVKNADGSTMSQNTEFTILLPNGEVLRLSDLSPTRYTAPTFSGDSAVIKITRVNDLSNAAYTDYDRYISYLINLGQRAGTFKIAAQEQGKAKSNYADCTPNARKNIYTEAEYTFDYSEGKAAMMPIKSGKDLPTTFTLPSVNDYVSITYDGRDGTEPGHLQTFTVDSWTIVSGDKNTAGSKVIVEGTLKDNITYTNHGPVYNTKSSKVILKYIVVENTGDAVIDTIKDFEFNTKTVGYSFEDLQRQTFTIKNMGTTDIHGMGVTIEPATVTGTSDKVEAFELTVPPAEMLKKTASGSFMITPKIGLPVGEYTSTVHIWSNEKHLDKENKEKSLQSFTIKFVVSPNPVYKITLISNDEDLGTAKTKTETYTALAGTNIEIIAEPKEDCQFVGWTVKDNTVSLTESETPKSATFVMPDCDVEIHAEFKELLKAKLKAQKLMIKDVDDNDQKFYNKDNKTGVWSEVTYDPSQSEYYVAVDNNVDKVKLWFTLRKEVENATFKMTIECNGTTDDTKTIYPKDTDGYFKSELFELDVSPAENKVTLDITYNDPDDNPDEGSQTKQYVFHIYRKIARSQLAQFKYGNSPYGLIMQDPSKNDQQKTDAKTAFNNNKYMFATGTAPPGGFENVEYTPEAWADTGTNYDLNDYALFVLNNDKFTDTGIEKLTNSIGKQLSNTDILKYSISVYELANTNSNDYGKLSDFVNATKKEVTLTSTTDCTDLINIRIRPGIYELAYQFKDFNGEILTNVTKPVIILSSVGDYNMDQAVNTKDAEMNYNRYNEKLASHHTVVDYNDGGRLYKYRVCDVNKDCNINAVDANNIRANKLNQFYKNTITQGGGA